MIQKSLLAMILFSSFATSALFADEVKVDGVHLCCGKCITGAKKSLNGVEGVSKVRVNKDDRTVVFEATDKKAAQKGLRSLAKAGFYGKPTVDGPKFKIDKTAKQDAVALSKMHLCCGGCVRAAVAAVKTVDGVSDATADAKSGKIDISGSSISLVAVLEALHEAGFHGSVK